MEISAKRNMNVSDDEDDLESLRLAALQTIKKPVINSIPQQQQPPPSVHSKPQHHARPHFSGPGRGGRGSHFNGRTQNTNLISIPVMENERGHHKTNRSKEDLPPAPKLILPQDRYCNKKQQDEENKTEVCSKFNRYDHSDESDSEDESEAESSAAEEGGKLHRADSLEALMEELEYEISGGTKPNKPEKPKVKKTKSKRKVSESEVKTEESGLKEDAEEKPEVVVDVKAEIEDKKETACESVKEELPVENKPEERLIAGGEKLKDVEEKEKEKPLPPRRRRSPLLNGRRHNINRNYHHPHQNGFGPGYPEPQSNFNFYQPPPAINYNQPPPSYPPTNHFVPHRPLSPLNLNTDVLSTIAMAPLSPRSAAFVLQNREIIERRKKSPRRSYSRSPSPSYNYRRPASPYRSPSPRSRSPPYSPPRRAVRNSPPRKTSPLRPARTTRKPTPPVKASVKERLGISRNDDKDKRSDVKNEKSDEPSIKDRIGRGSKAEDKEKQEEPSTKARKTEEPNSKTLEPVETDAAVLEARKRKFEGNAEVTAKEGIIRLKPKSENATSEDEEEPADDDLLDLVVNETMVDSLLSDEEESDDENEGRFKLQASKKATVIPFTQLSSNKDRNITALALEGRTRNNRRERECSRRRRKRSLSPALRPKKVRRSDEKASVKRHSGVKRERSKGKEEVLVDNKKSRSPDMQKGGKSEGTVRRVAITKSTKENKDCLVDVAEVIVDDDENDVSIKKDAGDLRAQLSRKRAERQQHKLPVATEDVQSRLLQNALEGAVFKNSRKLNSEKEAAPKEKLPIHMRLGLAKEPDKCKESKRRKKKSRNSEQV